MIRNFVLLTTIVALTTFAGLADVVAQTDVVPSSQDRVHQQWSEKTRVREANLRQTQNVPIKRADRVVCKQEPILGTRLKGMVTCRTAGDWRRISRGFQAELKRTNDKAALAYSGN